MLPTYVKPLSSGSVFPWLTADRIVTTNSLSQLATPSSVSTAQSVTLSGSATLTVAGLITAQSGLTVASNASVTGTATVTGLLTASSALTVASTVTLSLLTASRIATTNTLNQVTTPSAITTAQSLTLSSPATLTIGALTSGRIPYISTSGLIADSANLQFGSSNQVVGIRMTPHTWGANYAAVEFQGSALGEYYAGGNIQSSWLGNVYDSGAGNFTYGENGTASAFRMFPLSQLFRWFHANSGLAGGAATLNQKMELSNTALTIDSTVTIVVSSTSASSIASAGGISTGNTTLHTTTAALTNGAAANVGTLNNAPAAGNPTKWVPINDNGTTRYIPCW